jgi:hypothetical protein
MYLLKETGCKKGDSIIVFFCGLFEKGFVDVGKAVRSVLNEQIKGDRSLFG